MASPVSIRRKRPHAPPGCEGHLTRQQAAQVLGFPSEFKVRELEREGRLRSVRGPMRTAFYPREQVLAVKAELAQADPSHRADDDWSDADLVTLLGHPHREGRPRTPLDLVLETRISIERAEKVHAFWAGCQAPVGPSSGLPPAPSPEPTQAKGREDDPAAGETRWSHAPQERRSADRVSRDALIGELRHPDPRVREQAFARLRDRQEG
jgi:hypothetical protein